MGQAACKGNVVHFAQQIEEIEEQLPLGIDQVDQIIVNETFQNISKLEQFLVRPSYLYIGLEWLIKNNHLYSNVRKAAQVNKNFDINKIIIDSLDNFQAANNFNDPNLNKTIELADLSSNNQESQINNQSDALETDYYIIIDQSKSIIRADFNQGSEIFNTTTCGVQCSAICAQAIANSHVLKISEWNVHNLNQVLLEGDQYYTTCQNRLGHIIDPFNRYLEVQEVLGTITINQNLYRLQYKDNNIIDSSRQGITSSGNFLNHINEFLYSTCEHLMMVCADYTYVIFKCNQELYFFDSHAKTPTGRRSDNLNGKASVIKFKLPNSSINLANYLISLIKNGHVYTLTYITVGCNGVTASNLATDFIYSSPMETHRKSSKYI